MALLQARAGKLRQEAEPEGTSNITLVGNALLWPVTILTVEGILIIIPPSTSAEITPIKNLIIVLSPRIKMHA